MELSLIFPVILLTLILFMQFGLYFSYRIYTVNTIHQGLMICNRARQEKKTADETVQLVEGYINDALTRIPAEVVEVKCVNHSKWLGEDFIIGVTASYSFLFEQSWTSVGTCRVSNPVEFRNRVDFIWEKGKQYLDQGDNAS